MKPIIKKKYTHSFEVYVDDILDVTTIVAVSAFSIQNVVIIQFNPKFPVCIYIVSKRHSSFRFSILSNTPPFLAGAPIATKIIAVRIYFLIF